MPPFKPISRDNLSRLFVKQGLMALILGANINLCPKEISPYIFLIRIKAILAGIY